MRISYHGDVCRAACWCVLCRVCGWPCPRLQHLTAMRSLQGKSQSLVKASLRKNGRSLFARPSSAPKARRLHRDWAWHPQMTAVTTKHDVRRRGRAPLRLVQDCGWCRVQMGRRAHTQYVRRGCHHNRVMTNSLVVTSTCRVLCCLPAYLRSGKNTRTMPLPASSWRTTTPCSTSPSPDVCSARRT